MRSAFSPCGESAQEFFECVLPLFLATWQQTQHPFAHFNSKQQESAKSLEALFGTSEENDT
ncbi:unnamed protein product [Dovyalis caffra]|uniref:Uncharacterized protein n=1 Tax=Dovyalis caffra TaxID=77055 RepID=A0AAV1RRG7_9ROSI|nr:unnamed protein product [Dovyalis caffra]